METTPLYSSRIINTYVDYLKKNYPEIDISRILEHAGIAVYELEDEGHWLTQRQIDRFHDILNEKTNNRDISREVGRYALSSASYRIIRQFLLGFLTPAMGYAALEKFATHITRGHTFKARQFGSNSIEVITTTNPGVQENINQCKNRMGQLEGVVKTFTNRLPSIEHSTCIHKGGDFCRYIITWKTTPSFTWYRIRSYALLLGPIFLLAVYFMLSGESLLFLIPSVALIIMFIFYYSEHLEKKEIAQNIENQGSAAEELLHQINIRYNEALLVQEIGQATSMILDSKKLLQFIMEALEKRLDFDRGMIMLANKEKRRLVYAVGYGYKSDYEDYMQSTEFHLDNPLSRGVLVESFKKQQPFLVNDISEVERNLSPRSREFAKRIAAESFICVPIVYEGESMGVLLVDNVRTKRRLRQSDMSLLMGIAPQVAISLNNAISYQKIQESEERFRSLSENAPDIIYTLNVEGVFTHINPAWQRILGHKAEEVIGKGLVEFFREENFGDHARIIDRIRDKKETVRDVVGVILHENGTEKYFNMSGAPNLDAEGKVTGIVGIFKDITELKNSEEEIKQSYRKLQRSMDSIISSMSMIVETRDPYTFGHQEQVTKIACRIAEEMGLSEELISSIGTASILHDIGKINVPAEILSKPGMLTEIEMSLIKTHPQVGYNILKNIEFPHSAADIVLQHHERINGSGYPQGLSRNEILLEAKILGVADVIEAMASHRPYRAGLGIEQALEEISRNRGILYDEAVVDACLRLFREKGFTFCDNPRDLSSFENRSLIKD